MSLRLSRRAIAEIVVCVVCLVLAALVVLMLLSVRGWQRGFIRGDAATSLRDAKRTKYWAGERTMPLSDFVKP